MPGSGAAAGPPDDTAWIERWFLRVALGVGVAAWLALVLAEVGRLSPGLLLALLAAGAMALAAHARFVRRSPPAPSLRVGRRGLIAFGAVTLLAAFLFLPPYETVVAEGDATVYLGLSREVARTGGLVFDDPLLQELSVEAREYLFLNRQPTDFGYGRYARFPGGFTIADIGEPAVSSGFSPLFPVLAALFQQVSPPRGGLFVAPLFAVLSVGGLFLLVARLGGIRTGLLAALPAAASLPQIWFARYPLPEMVAQFFVVAALLALLAAWRDDRPWLAAAAGGLFGLACFAKIDMIFLLSVALAAFVAWRLLVRPQGGGRCVAFLLGAFGLVLLHNAAHYAAYPSDYLLYIRQQLDRSILALSGDWAVGLTALLLAGAGLALLAVRGAWRRLGSAAPRAAGWLLVGLLGAYGVVYATNFPGLWPDPLFWLSWYVSWPVLALGLAGVVGLAVSGRAGRAHQGAAFLLILVVVVSLHYLHNPLEPENHIVSMRRFVPVVLPGIFAVAALAAGRLVEWVYFEFRVVATTALTAVLVGLVGGPSASVLRQPLWEGALEQSAGVARTFPDGAAVLVSPELVGTHLQTSLNYLHGVDAVVVQQAEPGDVLGEVMLEWLARGRPVFVVLGQRGFSLSAPELVVSEVAQTSIDLRTLERTRGREPRELVDISIGLRILQVARGDGATARTGVDVGNLLDDLVAGLRGFHGPERDGRGDSFRWSEGAASVAIPGGDGVSLVVAGARPPGVDPAEISVWAGPHRIADGLVLGSGVQTITLDLPESERTGPTELSIRSSVFRPESLGLSPDRRSLGVRVYRVDVLRDSPSAPPTVDAAP